MAKTILVVDDSVIARQQVVDAVTGIGFDLVEAANGEEGLRCFKAASETVLVISDLNMPIMDGIEMAAAIRALPGGKTVPIVLVTTESSVGQIERSKAAGITGWLVKPFNPNHLKAAVKKATGT